MSAEQTEQPLAVTGWQALRRGAWEEARSAFEKLLSEDERSAPVWEGLGVAAWWQDDAETVFDARERAYRLYREEGDALGAARVATSLAMDYVLYRGEVVVAGGWVQRAHRLIDGREPAAEHALLALLEGLMATQLENDPKKAAQRARYAREVGKAIGELDVEMLGLALEGLSLVSEGKVEEGMRFLDEATTAATSGEMQDPLSIAFSCCYLIFACERVRDYDRAAQWCERIKEYCSRTGIHALLSICQAHYGSVLAFRGRFEDAESELERAAEDMTTNRPGIAAEALVRLGELRLRQGRFDEAERLFLSMEAHPYAQLGLGELALERGDPTGAIGRGERFLRRIPEANRTERAAGLELVARASTLMGDHEGAWEAIVELRSVAEDVETDLLKASAKAAEGMLFAAKGELDEARHFLEDAVDLYQGARVPLEAARTRLALSRVLARLSRNAEAVRELERARGTLVEIGSVSLGNEIRDLAALIGEHDIASGPLSDRELQVLALVAEGFTDHEIADRLVLSEHTIHRHVANIRTKLGVNSRAAAVAEAAQQGII